MQVIIQTVVLALVQGVTEFLPVSSSAHLILVPALLGWEDQGLMFDSAVHVGTLVALISYYWHELKVMVRDFIQSLIRGRMTTAARLSWIVGFATIPVGLAGLIGKPWIESSARSPWLIACTTILFGLLLGISDKWGKKDRSIEALNWKDAMWIGGAEALSLLPGTSRSGVTLSAGLGRGLRRSAAAQFSFLLSLPVIVLVGGLQVFSSFKSSAPVEWGYLILGMIVSGISGYFCIHFFIKLLNKVGVWPFVIYRLLLGTYLIVHFA